MVKRAYALVASLCLAMAPLLTAPTAQAAVPLASVPVACADAVSSLTVTVDEIVTFGPVPSGCAFVSNSSTGNLDRVSANGFVAFAVGSGALFQLMADAADPSKQYLVKVNVTIIAKPTPTPTPTSTSVPSATSTGTSTAAPTSTDQATTAPPASAVPLAPAIATAPQPSQQLRPRNVSVGEALEPGTLAFFNDKGHPLQLLSVSGDREAVRVLNRGMNYTSQPSNWQRLGYGDLCWSYAGYSGVQGLILPVATPPFRTVPADWVLTAAIAMTSSGNAISLDPVPGQVLTAGGREIKAVTLCAEGRAPSAMQRSIDAKGTVSPRTGNIGGNVGTGQCRGNGNFKHGCEPAYSGVSGGVVWPVLPGGTSTTPTQQPTASSTSTPSGQGDPLVPICQATADPQNPYRLIRVRQSELPTGQGSRLFPTQGWTDVIPPTRANPAGQNWPAGAAMLLATDGLPCTVAQPVAVPTATPTSTPTPPSTPSTPSTTTVSPLPQPTITATSPVTVVTAEPQPTFTGFTALNPWPPLYPIPVLPQLIPTPMPTASPATASPYATPTPTTYATPSPFATPPPPTVIPATPTPYPTPPSPSAYATPTATPYPTPSRMPQVPTLVPPLLPPSVALTPVIRIPQPEAAMASPTASPSTEDSPSVAATPTATPSPMTASPTATPLPTATDAASPRPTATGIASAKPSAGPSATGTVSFLLTNGPDNVTVTLPVSELLTLTNQGGVPGKVPAKDPSTAVGGELASTGSSVPWLLLVGVALTGAGLVFLATARRGRIRLVLVVAATAAGVTLSTTAAWSVASQERVFSTAQLTAAQGWSAQSAAIGRLTFERAGGQPVTGLDPVYVFDGVDDNTLAQGPGRYPGTAAIGGRGNTAIAGHRTGWGSPFAELDALQSGDVITLDSPNGDRRTYVVDDVRLVAPDDTWVLGDDPLGTGTSTLTLTTCDPPGVNTRRLIVFASLVSGSSPA